MPILKRLREYLDQSKVKYEVQDHPEAFTAQKVAQSLHERGQNVAKVVIVKDDAHFHMIVLPAVYNVDLARLGPALGLKSPRLATEEEFETLFPGCETGAMPPFGNLYEMPVAVDRSLTEDEHIVCQAGNHRQTVTLKYKDFERLVQPKVVEVGVHV